MPQSLSKAYMHCVFFTKKCMLLITNVVRKDLHSYIIVTLSNIGSWINNLVEGLSVGRQVSQVSSLQDFYSNINSITQGFVTLRPVLLPVGALPGVN